MLVIASTSFDISSSTWTSLLTFSKVIASIVLIEATTLSIMSTSLITLSSQSASLLVCCYTQQCTQELWYQQTTADPPTMLYLGSLPNLTLQFCFGRYSCHIWQKLLQSNSTRKNPRRRIEGGGWMWLYKLFISIILLLVSAFKYNASNLMMFSLPGLVIIDHTSIHSSVHENSYINKLQLILATFNLSSNTNLTLQFCFCSDSCLIHGRCCSSPITTKEPRMIPRRRIEGGTYVKCNIPIIYCCL